MESLNFNRSIIVAVILAILVVALDAIRFDFGYLFCPDCVCFLSFRGLKHPVFVDALPLRVARTYICHRQ